LTSRINLRDGLYEGWSLASMPPEAETALLAENEARMRRLYPGALHDDLLLLQRRGYVCYWRKHPETLRVGNRDMPVAEFTALAERERARVQQHQREQADDDAIPQPLLGAAE